MFSELVVIGVFDLVEVIFVQLANEGSEVGVFEHSWEDGFGELVHVLGSDG